MKLKTTKISDLTPHPKNINRHPEEQLNELESSLEQFEQVKNIVAWNNKVIAGCGLLEAAKRQGKDVIEVQDVSDWPEEKAIKYMISDNRLPELAIMDDDLLSGLLAEFDEPLDIPGIDEGFLDELDFGDDSEGGNTDSDSVPEDVKPVVKSGELWLCGEHRVLCGDATRQEDVERLMDGKKAEILFTSPPYADMRDYEGCDLFVDNLIKFIPIFYPFVNYQIINLGIQRKDNEIVQYWDKYIKSAKDAGYKFLSWNVWDQIFNGAIGKAMAMFRIEHEWIFVFGRKSKKLSLTIPNKDAGLLNDHHSDRQKNGATQKKKNCIIRDSRELGTVMRIYPYLARNVGENHPAMFPVELPEEYIKAMTFQNDIVVDPFLGSGSTLIACEKTNRICYGVEISETYCDIILQRWADFTGKIPYRLNNDGTKTSWEDIK